MADDTKAIEAYGKAHNGVVPFKWDRLSEEDKNVWREKAKQTATVQPTVKPDKVDKKETK